jgi:hypothetical protein
VTPGEWMSDDVANALAPPAEVTERVLAALDAWDDPEGTSGLVRELARLVYLEERKLGRDDAHAFEVMQQVIVGNGLGAFEEELEDARAGE